jgi:hypothetical protein
MPLQLRFLLDKLRFLTFSQKITLGVVGLLVVALPVFVVTTQIQSANRSSAAAATVISFYPEDKQARHKQVGDTIELDVLLDPGKNLISTTKLEILYDKNKLQLEKPEDFQIGTSNLSMVLDGPTFSDGKIVVSLGLRTVDPTLVLQTKTVLAKVKFKTIAPTTGDGNGGYEELISFGPETTALSVASTDLAGENVISQKIPANIKITGGGALKNIFSNKPGEARTITGKYISETGQQLQLGGQRVYLGREDAGVERFTSDNPRWQFTNLIPGEKYTITINQIPGYKVEIAHCTVCNDDSATFVEGNTVDLDVVADRSTQVAVKFVKDNSYIPPVGNKIIGRYVLANGSPVTPQNARVLVSWNRQTAGLATADAPNWEFNKLKEGTYTVSVDQLSDYDVSLSCKNAADCLTVVRNDDKNKKLRKKGEKQPINTRRLTVRVDEKRNTEVLVTLTPLTDTVPTVIPSITASIVPTGVSPTKVDACNACAADVNGDGQVTTLDYADVTACTPPNPNASSQACVSKKAKIDVLKDGAPDITDVNCIFRMIGAACKR